MKHLIIACVGQIFLRFCVGLRINDDCQIIHDLKRMKNATDDYVYEDARSNKRLFLMSSLPVDDEYAILNRKLKTSGRALGFTFETVFVPNRCSYNDQFYFLTLTETLSKYYEVINLRVNIPFNYYLLGEEEDYVDISKGYNELSLVGHTYTENEVQEVCKSTENKTNGNYENCEHTTENITVLYGKLISNSIKSYKLLYKVLKNISLDYDISELEYWERYRRVTKNEPIKRRNIVICANQEIAEFEYRTGLERYNRHIIYNCDNVNDFKDHDAIAVIAPKPYKNEEFTSLPVIFYDDIAPYLLPKDEGVYPNSVTLYGKYFQEMSSRLIQFIQLQPWKRVAIVSDDSLYSQDFEELMTNLFVKNNFIYSAHQCSGSNCNFHQALKYLKNADARIIIANVDEKYAKKLIDTIIKLELSIYAGVLWIFRVGSLEKFPIDDIYDKLGEVLYMTVWPEDFAVRGKERNKKQIIKALSYFEHAIYSSKKEDSVKIRNFSSTLIKKVEELQSRPVVYIRKITRNKMHENEVVFNSTNRQKPIFKKIGYVDQDQGCSFRKLGYASECEDSYPIIVMVLILVLLLATLTIIIIYTGISPLAKNYRPF